MVMLCGFSNEASERDDQEEGAAPMCVKREIMRERRTCAWAVVVVLERLFVVRLRENDEERESTSLMVAVFVGCVFVFLFWVGVSEEKDDEGDGDV